MFLAALFALAIVVARLLSRALTRPVMRLSRVASATTNGIVITDVDGRVEWINNAFSRMSGYTLGEIRGRKPGDLLQDADADPATVARMRDALAQGQDFEAELLNHTKHGAPYWVHISCNALHGDDGKQQGYMAVETDVTERKRFEAALQRERQRLADIIWGTNAGTWEWNVQTGETCFNERWAEIIGYTLAELEPVSITTWIDHTHPDDLARSNAALRRHFQGETDAYECEARMRHKDGRWVWVLDRGRVISYTADGEPLWVSGTHVDITIRKEAQLRVDELLSQLQKLVAKVPGVVYQYQQWPDGRAAFPYASEGLRDIYGIRPEDVIEDASLVFDAVHPEDRPRVAASIDASFRSLSTWHEHYRSVLPDGKTIWLDGQAEPEPMPDGSVLWHGYIRDVTALKEYQNRLERIAHYDPVTGLANRELLGDRLHSAMANADRRENYIAVVYLDLDGFKAVNDTHGHSQGDALLKEIGHKIMTCLRETDTAARIGGDEFAVVLTDLPEPQASTPIIDRLLRLLAEPVSLSDAQVRVSASAGVTFYPQAGPVESDQLVRQADQAMYAVKRTGKNGCRAFSGATLPRTGSI